MDVEPDASSLRWEDVHGPARGVVYGLLRGQDAALADALHDSGWKGHVLKPLGVTSPQFKGAPKKKGVYTTSSEGSVWFGSPVPEIAAALVAGLATRKELVWGAARLRMKGFALETSAPVADGPVELETATPVIVKHESRHLLPGDEHFLERLQHNLAHKADVLGLPAPSGLRVLEAGPRRRFTVRGAPRIGAQVRVFMEADARFVEALRCWGMGLDTVQGFGWVR
ncbi:CRISPR-associated endoribonuclease Cas6 [Streptomyces aidingensis]|uniref:CRISPR-associated endoribonuclease Cas6 n=1 Tax=Streptomyces aidingensis TaxID=910347 RepID=UPI001FE31CFD|nr:CRISPR-associated endoribonuclease Cas6 [Streptomyces aidingensis]